MRQNAYTFRRPSYERNATPVLNKKISLPPAYREYTPVLTFRNNFSTPAMSGMRGLQSMPGLNITPDVANDAYVSFKFNVPIISDIKAAELARREVKTTSMAVTVSMLNNLPSIQLVAIANQLLNLPASPAKNSFISVVYKLLKDMASIPGPPLADRLAMLDALDKLETVQPGVVVPPAVILPGGAVGVIVPPGGVAPVAPGVAVVAPGDEIKQAINDLFVASTFQKGELDDIDNKINALTDIKEKQQYQDLRQIMLDTIDIHKDIKALQVNGYGDPDAKDIDIRINNIQDADFKYYLEQSFLNRMAYLGIGPPPPSGPPITPGGPAGPELIYTFDELKDLKDKKDPEYKNFINSIDQKGVGFYRTPKDKWPALGSITRDAYVDDWKNNNTINGTDYLTLVKGQLNRANTSKNGPDPEGLHSNKRGFIHMSMR